jgi:Phage terminase large subunit (GpA)
VNPNEKSIQDWIITKGIKTETGKPLDFTNHLFLYDIYNDWSPKLVCYKAAQIGFSTMAIIKSLYAADRLGLDCIYTLPTANDVKDFVGGKANRIINNNPYLQTLVQDKDSVEQKRVGNNVIYYRGTWTEKAALMVTSDLNIHDEEDRSKQEVIQQYASRLQHSAYKWEWHFSNPSVEGNGVSRYWNSSDQKHWFIKCSKCQLEQYLKWPESIDMERRQFICRSLDCKRELTKEERRVGRWVKKYKDKEYSGYWISLLMAPWITADEIIKYYETKSKEYFWNFVLGLPYVGEGNTVTPDVIFRNLTGSVNSQERVVIGCDSGLIKHFVLGNSEGLFYYGKTDTWETIEGFLKKFPKSVAVIDALPDLTEPRKLREKYPGRVFLVHYARDRKTMEFWRWGKNEESGNVNVDRNRTIQLVIDEFADRRIPLQGTQDDWADYYHHWDDIYRVNEMEEAKQAGNKNYVYSMPFRWDTKTGQDHWVHATVYWRVGMDKFSIQGGIIKAQPDYSFPSAPTVSVDQTIPAPNPRKIFKFTNPQEDDWRT